MNSLNKYLAVVRISVQSNLAYVGEAATRFIFLAVILYIFFRLWQSTYSTLGAQAVAGLSLPEMLWYLAITESIMMSAPRVSSVVDEDVRSGSLAVQLIRPLSYPLYRLATTLGERLVRFISTAAVACILAWFLVGTVNLSLSGIVIFALALPLAFTLDFLGNFLVGLGAFWMENTSGLQLLYSRMTMILGGMLMPIDLFPAAAQPVLKSLPFAWVVCGPSRLFVHPTPGGLAEVLIHQLVSVCILGLTVSLVYSLASRRVFANGG